MTKKLPERQRRPREQHVYFGREVAEGNREAVTAFDLKKRPYLGPTSMDNELALVMANMAHAGKGKICFDPFAGTGSILVVRDRHGLVLHSTHCTAFRRTSWRHFEGSLLSVERSHACTYSLCPMSQVNYVRTGS